MSEVKRYDCTNGRAQHCYGCYQMTETEHGAWVLDIDYDAAQIELAALLEELATQDRVLRSLVPDEHKSCTSPVGAVQNHIGDLEQRLADAERRNALVESLLRESLEEDDGTSDWFHQVISALRDRPIDAALTKPEEAKS